MNVMNSLALCLKIVWNMVRREVSKAEYEVTDKRLKRGSTPEIWTDANWKEKRIEKEFQKSARVILESADEYWATRA